MKKNILSSFLIIEFVLIGYSQSQNNRIFDNPPDSIPRIFAEGIISIQDRYEYGIAISPDYDELFFTAENPGEGLMIMTKLDNGSWTFPKVANLRGDNSWEYEAFYTSDGQKLYFTSDINDTSRLWFSLKEKATWSAAKILESPVNSTPVFWATFTENNAMYYTNLAVYRIYKSYLIDNQYAKTEDIGLTFGMHPFVSEDESFILFNGKGDIYIIFYKNDGSWTEPVKLGKYISTSEFEETCPSLSPDEKYIFFSRYNDLNQKSDIYWVSSNIINEIKREIMKN